MPQTTQLVTFNPQGSPASARWLSQQGFVSNLVYSFANPGGCDTLTAKFMKPPKWRGDALQSGRLIFGVRGGTIVWSGILDEPIPSDTDGWDITAHGAGQFGKDYLGIYSVAWGTGVFNDIVDQAIARGLDWVRGLDIGAVANIFTGQQVDSGTEFIPDLLSLGCEKGGLTWSVTTGAGGANTLSVYALPTVANRILISGQPEARSIGDGPSTLYARYQSAADTTKAPAVNSLTSVTQSAEETAHGRRENIMDITSAGTYTSGLAQGVASSVLQRYQRAAFADAFLIQPGELLSQGGTPQDLGFYLPDGLTSMVCELWLSDFGYGGDVTPGPMKFLVGNYSYDQDANTATAIPFESALHDFASLMQGAVDSTPPRTQPIKKKKKRK